MIHEFNKPIEVVTPLGDAYAIYCESSGMFYNDIWTCVLKDGGDIKHFNTSQLKIFKNQTFNIHERKTDEETKSNG